ncbi:DNA-binding response regulator [Anaerobacillus alkalidiazotrophicus]|uniref:DNA-binding response regulator n=1 Tax=Anaerobacillus alkalidiazotrophicus TaxID=472963 RepID=A0A1S2M2B3_9BACI|nr:response regulator transcription factor [Anaerobacillus alkalidiazotrophicus]OIJ18879.1 DNA-binding response regulator [Anaerobacillus alkalidiazotrophicus]
MGKKVLIVDDEKEMRILLSVCLKPSGYEIDEAQTGFDALQKVMDVKYDLIILDIMMPTVDGFEVLTNVREMIDKDVPIIMLTALGETDRIVEGLQLGADDYIVKPFEPKELIARIESVMRRSKRTELEDVSSYQIHGLLFEEDKMRVSYASHVLTLTKKEYKLLVRLAKNPGRVYSREQLVQLEWDDDHKGDTRMIDTHIKNVREKLKAVGLNKQIIETVWGVGYQMIDNGSK